VNEPAAESVRCDCLLGRCDSMRAEVYVRCVGPAGTGRGRLTGTLSGPECRWATTLPVTTTIRPVPGELPDDAAETILGRVVLTEPAYWTPELPNRYRLVAAAETDGRVIETVRQTVGLRRLGVRGRSLWLDGRRFVPRGAVAAGAEDEVEAFREAALTAVVTDPAETFLDGCDAAGVAVVARCHDTVSDAAAIAACRQRIVAWSRHPAVFVAVLPAALPTDQAALILADTRAARGTLLVAVEVDGTLPPSSLPSGCDAIVVALPAGGLPHPAWRTLEPTVPLIAARADACDAALSRRPCDALQADLATWGTAGGPPAHDWAGYLVGRVPEPGLSRP
jgi:hypothetical protein